MEGAVVGQPGYRQVGNGEILKPAQIIMAIEKGNLELVDRKTYNYLLNRVYKDRRLGYDGTIHRVAVSEVLQFLGHTSTDRLHRSLERLSAVNIVIGYVDDEGVSHSVHAHYLSCDMAHSPTGWVEFWFDPILRRFISSPKVFGRVTLCATHAFRSDYSARLYEIMALQANKRHPVWEPSLEAFREHLSVGDNYARYDNLRRRVVDLAVDEVNAIAPFSVDVTPVRVGRGGRIGALRFTAEPKGLRALQAIGEGMSLSAAARKANRDPNTPDLLDGKADHERDPLALSEETLRAAAEIAGDGGSGHYVEEWRDRMRSRRVRDPDRAFLNWLDVQVAKGDQTEGGDLGMLDDDAIASLVEGWESTH